MDAVERLVGLLNDGMITANEFESLKAEILAPSDKQESDPAGIDIGGPDPRTPPNPADLDTQQDIPWLYWVALGAGTVSTFLGGFFGLLAWATVAVGLWALFSVKTPRGRWMAWLSVALGLIFSLVNLYLNGHLDFVSSPTPTAQAIPTTVPFDLLSTASEIATTTTLPITTTTARHQYVTLGSLYYSPSLLATGTCAEATRSLQALARIVANAQPSDTGSLIEAAFYLGIWKDNHLDPLASIASATAASTESPTVSGYAINMSSAASKLATQVTNIIGLLSNPTTAAATMIEFQTAALGFSRAVNQAPPSC